MKTYIITDNLSALATALYQADLSDHNSLVSAVGVSGLLQTVITDCNSAVGVSGLLQTVQYNRL